MTDYPAQPNASATASSSADDAKESKFKNYVIEHMNTDHSDSLVIYAKHYGKLASAKSAELIDISLTGMKLAVQVQANGSSRTEHITVPFTKPLTDSSKYRVVLVEMAKEAAAALGIEVGTDESKARSQPGHQLSNASYFKPAKLPISATIVVALYLTYCAAYHTGMPTGTYWVRDLGLKIFRSRQNIGFVFWAAVAAHAFESVLAYRECQAKGVTNVGTQLAWVAQTFLVGGPSLMLLKKLKPSSSKKHH